MFRRVLVPLDGSPLAEYALPTASRIARMSGGSLILFRVYQVSPSVYVPELVMSAYTTDEEAADVYLKSVARRGELAGIPIETHAFAGETALTILDAANEYQADLIIMTSHGRSGVTRWVLGSVAEHVVRHALQPVLVLRGTAETVAQPQRVCGGPWRALVTLDGSDVSESAIGAALRLLNGLRAYEDGELLLLRLLKPSSAPATSPGAEDEASRLLTETHRLIDTYARQSMAKAAATLQASAGAVSVRWGVAEAQDYADGIIRYANAPAEVTWFAHDGTEQRITQDRQPGVSFIAMATHGRAGIQRWTLGSVAEHVLEGTNLPLLLVHPEEPAVQAAPLERVE